MTQPIEIYRAALIQIKILPCNIYILFLYSDSSYKVVEKMYDIGISVSCIILTFQSINDYRNPSRHKLAVHIYHSSV